MEREIEIAGHWIIFALIFGMVLSMAGIVGTVLGYASLDPSQAIAHPILHPLARFMVTIGPIVLFTGAAMFLGSIYGIHQRKNAPSPTMAPRGFRGFYPLAQSAYDESADEAEDGMAGRSMDFGRGPLRQTTGESWASNDA